MRLYNGMIAPLVPYAIRGVTWYQGENNTHQGEAGEYAAMMEAMVRTWREKWGQGDWPFLFVQIAPYGKYRGPADSLPIMWEQQTQALGLIANSGMAVTGDVGNANDIHPKEKRVVGERLAAIALAKTYGRKDVAWEPPLVKLVTLEKDSVRVHFTTPVKQTVEKLTAFETERDGKFQPVEAIVKDGDVIIKDTPAFIRFQWSPTAEPQLVNDAGLPAVAFSKPIY
jgi:sialate O-acetylesterase